MEWRETRRRLSDGITIETRPITVGHPPQKMDDWISVMIMGPVGYFLCQSTMRIDEALVEIPFLLDRAREFERAFQGAQAT